MRTIHNDIAVERVFAFDARSGTSTSYGETIDRLGFESVGLFFEFGTYGGGIHEFEVHGSDDGETWEDLTEPTDPDSFPYLSNTADLTAELPVFEDDDGGSPTASALSGTVVKVGLVSGHRYYRVEAAATGATGNEWGVYAVLGHPTQRPVA